MKTARIGVVGERLGDHLAMMGCGQIQLTYRTMDTRYDSPTTTWMADRTRGAIERVDWDLSGGYYAPKARRDSGGPDL